MRTDGAADDVMRVADVRHPVPNRLVGGVLQRRRTAVDGDHLGAQKTHLVHVECLAAHVFATHVHEASEAESGAGRRCGNAVLPRTGLRDDPALAHALREEHLAERVVELVRAGVQQVLAFEVDLRPGVPAAEAARMGDRRRAPCEFGEPSVQLRR